MTQNAVRMTYRQVFLIYINVLTIIQFQIAFSVAQPSHTLALITSIMQNFTKHARNVNT